MKNLLKELLGSEVIRYYPSLAKYVGGATAALYLSQLLYWHFNDRMQKRLSDKDGWFYISINDMEYQTGLTEREQETVRKKLLVLKIIDISYKGMSPRTTHFKLNIEKLEVLISLQSARNVPTNERETS